MTEKNMTSISLVTTSRAQRYGKQLTSHLSRKHGGEWTDERGTGWVDLGGYQAQIKAHPDALRLSVTAPADEIATLEDVLGRHLVHFATKDHLTVRWHHSDGTPGSEQATTPATE